MVDREAETVAFTSLPLVLTLATFTNKEVTAIC
jgi:hypothetical protein